MLALLSRCLVLLLSVCIFHASPDSNALQPSGDRNDKDPLIPFTPVDPATVIHQNWETNSLTWFGPADDQLALAPGSMLIRKHRDLAMHNPRFFYASDNTRGIDSQGNSFHSVDDMWDLKFKQALKKYQQEAKGDPRRAYYLIGIHHWKNNNNMLGDFPDTNQVDLLGSSEFLHNLNVSYSYALDVAAGIGRVTEHLLLPRFHRVDMEEQDAGMVEKARKRLSSHRGMRDFFAVGIQDFKVPEGRYSVIWIQWAFMYSYDGDIVEFLRRCVRGLQPNGMIIVKDNASGNGFWYDDEDGAITRDVAMFEHLYEQAGLRVVDRAVNKGMPPKLLDLWIWALQPVTSTQS